MKVGFIGLGHMGLPMAANLLAGGYEVVVFNRTASKADELVAGGAERAGSPAELAASCDVIMACLLTPDVCEQIFLGDGGVVEAAKTDSLIIDFSTNGPDTSPANLRCREGAWPGIPGCSDKRRPHRSQVGDACDHGRRATQRTFSVPIRFLRYLVPSSITWAPRAAGRPPSSPIR